MKKAILISIIVLGTVYQTFAQQKGKTKHMIISIYENYGGAAYWGKKSPNVFVMRDDTAQVRKTIEFDPPHLKLKEVVPAHEEQIMQMLEPYYNSGWKLVTVSSVKDISEAFYITRFFFTKDK